MSLEAVIDQHEQVIMTSDMGRRIEVDRTEAAYEAIKNAKNLRFDTKLSETIAISKLAPRKASELLGEQDSFSDVPESLQTQINLRQSAHVLAEEIVQNATIDEISLLTRLVGGLKLDQLNNGETVGDIIREKIGIIAAAKIFELIRGKVTENFDLTPSEIHKYLENILGTNLLSQKLESISERSPFLNVSMENNVNSNEWNMADEATSVVSEMEQVEFGKDIWRNLEQLSHSIKISAVWKNENLSTENIPTLSSERVERIVTLSTRYFSWKTYFNRANGTPFVAEDLHEIVELFTNENNPGYLGHQISKELLASTVTELKIVENNLFN